MLEGLQNEIDAHPEFVGASNRIIKDALNKDGTAQTETWVVSDEPRKLNRTAMLGYVSVASLEAIADFKETDQGKAFKLLFESGSTYDFAHPTTRQMTQNLADAGVITQTEADSLLRVGERSISRAEELWSRKLELEDFE